MIRTPDFDIARKEAEEKKLAYGMCVTDGLYIVGTKEQLDKLPVVIKFDYSE